MPKISVIMPTYNRENFIREAIMSVLKQNYRDFEIVIVDDGSTDGTRKIIKSIKDSRIIYIFQKNLGRSVARNKAIEVARGKYLAFLDSDDMFLPSKLKKQIDILEKNVNYGMVYTSALNVNEQGEILDYVYRAFKSGNIYKDVAFFLPVVITLPTVMVRKEIVVKLGGFDKKMERFEDTDMWRRIAKITQVWAIEEPLTKIRYHSGNQMEHPEKFLKALDYYIQKALSEDDEFEWSQKRQAASLLYRNYASAVKNHPRESQLTYLFWMRSLYYWPIWPPLFVLSVIFTYFYRIFCLFHNYLYRLLKMIFPNESTRKRIKLYIKERLVH